jgi:hypothetical protein
MFSPMPICEDRRLHHAGEAGKRRAEAEHQRVKKLDIDAERPTISRLEVPTRVSMPSRKLHAIEALLDEIQHLATTELAPSPARRAAKRRRDMTASARSGNWNGAPISSGSGRRNGPDRSRRWSRPCGGRSRPLSLEARRHVPGDELHAGAARVERKDGVGLRRAGLGKLGRKIELSGHRVISWPRTSP